jgi:Fe-S cluster biogenesis protein NfuA
MAATVDSREIQGRLERLDAVLWEVNHSADLATQAHAAAVVDALLDWHATALERLQARLAEAGDAGREALDACAADDVVAGMLLLHGLHPRSVEVRVRQALDSVRPYLRSHGGNVELLGVTDGVVRLRLEGSCHHCSSSTVTMQQTIEQAIYGHAPEVAAVEVEGTTAGGSSSAREGGRVSLPVL